MPDSHVIRNGDITVSAPSALGAVLLYRAGVAADPTALALLMRYAEQTSEDEVRDIIKQIHEQVARLTAEAEGAE